jgi:hypothetical protein
MTITTDTVGRLYDSTPMVSRANLCWVTVFGLKRLRCVRSRTVGARELSYLVAIGCAHGSDQ